MVVLWFIIGTTFFILIAAIVKEANRMRKDDADFDDDFLK
jgi:hypothetical protein